MSNYWKRAGNARWGMQMLARDIQQGLHPRTKKESVPNTIYSDRESKHGTDNVQPAPIDSLGSGPTYNYYNYNYPSQPRVFRTFSFWKSIAMILFLMFIVVFTYYLVFEPEMISNTFHRAVEFLHSI